MLLMADAELSDETPDRIEDRVQRVAVAGEDHPSRERSRAFAIEHIERAVDDVARIRFTGTGSFNRICDARRHGIGDRACKRTLKVGSGPEMVEQIGVGPSDLCRDRLQRHRLRPVGDEKPPSCVDRGRSAFLRAQSSASY